MRFRRNERGQSCGVDGLALIIIKRQCIKEELIKGGKQVSSLLGAGTLVARRSWNFDSLSVFESFGTLLSDALVDELVSLLPILSPFDSDDHLGLSRLTLSVRFSEDGNLDSDATHLEDSDKSDHDLYCVRNGMDLNLSEVVIREEMSGLDEVVDESLLAKLADGHDVVGGRSVDFGLG